MVSSVVSNFEMTFSWEHIYLKSRVVHWVDALLYPFCVDEAIVLYYMIMIMLFFFYKSYKSNQFFKSLWGWKLYYSYNFVSNGTTFLNLKSK